MSSLSILPLLAAETTVAAGEIARSEWWITGAAAGVLLLLLIAFNYMTQAGIIARATTKEAVRQPVFFLLLAIAAIMLVLNTFLPFFSLGDDVKMLKDCGLATLLVSGLLLAIWTSSSSIADEIEGKTAMTLLSKPINRRQFVLGKYFGVLQGVLFLLVPLFLFFLLLIYYKVGYDAREHGGGAPEHAEKMAAVWQIIPGLILSFLEISVLTAVSVAISTRLPMMVNMVVCFTVFVVGHLTPVLVKTVLEGMEFVQFTAQLFATVLPSLEVFNMSAAVATGSIVPPSYLGLSAVYAACYVTAAILVAFILFEDRDLA